MKRTFIQKKSSFFNWFRLPKKGTKYVIAYPDLNEQPDKWLQEPVDYRWYWQAASHVNMINTMAEKNIAIIIEIKETYESQRIS